MSGAITVAVYMEGVECSTYPKRRDGAEDRSYGDAVITVRQIESGTSEEQSICVPQKFLHPRSTWILMKRWMLMLRGPVHASSCPSI